MNKKVKIMLFIEIVSIFLLCFFVRIEFVDKMPGCVFYTRFGILCPTCGGTRCVINFFRGDFINSFLYHPIFFLVIIYLIILNIVVILNFKNEKKICKWIYPKPYMAVVFALILLMFWIIRNLL